jgi:hypothetical protein
MDTILFAILFIIPGLLVRNIEKRIYTKTKEKDSDFVKQYNFFIDSAFIYFIGFLIYQLLHKTPIVKLIKDIELNGIFLEGNNLKLFILYFFWALIICFPYAMLKKYIIEKIFIGVSNTYRGKKKMPLETVFSSVWDEIFENPKVPITDDQIIIIEKDGETITQGYIKRFSPPHLSKREFLLEETLNVKVFMDYDSNCENEDEKLLNVLKMEYYDTQTGILIKFVDDTKLVNYLKQNTTDS